MTLQEGDLFGEIEKDDASSPREVEKPPEPESKFPSLPLYVVNLWMLLTAKPCLFHECRQ